MMGCLCLDKNLKPLRDSIIWADTRSQKQADEIAEKVDLADFYKLTGHRLSPSHTLTKFMWVKEHQPEIYKNTYKTVHTKDYIAYKLTGVLATDYSDASGTMAFGVRNKCWSSELLAAAD